MGLQRNVSWCPTVPGTCGSALWDVCVAAEARDRESPLAANSCTAAQLQPACKGLIVVKQAGSSGLYDLELAFNRGANDTCPKQLRDPAGSCRAIMSQVWDVN